MTIGGTGLTSDVVALKKCPFFVKIATNRAMWLGEDGFILGDGVTIDPNDILLTPINIPI